MAQVTHIIGRGELQTLTVIPKFVLFTTMTELPLCPSWLLLWNKNIPTKILQFNLESQN